MKFIKTQDSLAMIDVARLGNFSATLKDGLWFVTARDESEEIPLKIFDEAQEAVAYMSELNTSEKAAGKTPCAVSEITISCNGSGSYYLVKIISAYYSYGQPEEATIAVCNTLEEARACMEKLARALEEL